MNRCGEDEQRQRDKDDMGGSGAHLDEGGYSRMRIGRMVGSRGSVPLFKRLEAKKRCCCFPSGDVGQEEDDLVRGLVQSRGAVDVFLCCTRLVGAKGI